MLYNTILKNQWYYYEQENLNEIDSLQYLCYINQRLLREHPLMWSVCWVDSYDNLIFKRIINVLKCSSMVVYNIFTYCFCLSNGCWKTWQNFTKSKIEFWCLER